jgi:hypothetical protein
MQNSALAIGPPWWKFGHVWLVLAGPALVVFASCVTFYIAASRPDPVLGEDSYQKGIQINKTLEEAASQAPALQARNHAATGVIPIPKVERKP